MRASCTRCSKRTKKQRTCGRRYVAPLTQCIALPSESVSHIQLDAFKKLILVRLLAGHPVEGEALLKHTSVNVRSQYLRQAGAYLALAHNYRRMRSGSRDLHTLLAAHAEQFAADANTGLVQQCVAAQPQRLVEALARIYATLPLDAVAAYLACTPDEARSALASTPRVDVSYADGPQGGAFPLPDGVGCTLAASDSAPYAALALRPDPPPRLPAEHEGRTALAALVRAAHLAPSHLAKLAALHGAPRGDAQTS